MKTITHRGTTYRLPFLDLLRPLHDTERAGLVASITSHGILHNVLVYDSREYGENCVIDGMNRLEIAAAEDIGFPVEKTKITDAEARELAWSLNRDRRHLTPEEQAKARAERVQRIADKRAEGKSLRAIAEEEGVSQEQVRQDVKEAGVKGLTPEKSPNGSTSGVKGLTPEPPKVKGKDGKSYPAKATPRKSADEHSNDSASSVAAKSDPESVKEANDAEGKAMKALDGYGIPVQPHAAKAWEAVAKFKELIRKTRELQREFGELADMEGAVWVQNNGRSSFHMDRSGKTAGSFKSLSLAQFIRDLEDSIPTYSVCPWRFADKPHPTDCSTCKGLDWAPPLMSGKVPEDIAERVKEEYGV